MFPILQWTLITAWHSPAAFHSFHSLPSQNQPYSTPGHAPPAAVGRSRARAEGSAATKGDAGHAGAAAARRRPVGGARASPLARERRAALTAGPTVTSGPPLAARGLRGRQRPLAAPPRSLPPPQSGVSHVALSCGVFNCTPCLTSPHRVCRGRGAAPPMPRDARCPSAAPSGRNFPAPWGPRAL